MSRKCSSVNTRQVHWLFYLPLREARERTKTKDSECHSIPEGAEDGNNVFIVCATAIFTWKENTKAQDKWVLNLSPYVGAPTSISVFSLMHLGR